MPKLPDPQRYTGLTGYLKVAASTSQGESPIWCPVRIESANIGYQKMFLLIEPIGGFGSVRVVATRVWLEDNSLNLCPEKPV